MDIVLWGVRRSHPAGLLDLGRILPSPPWPPVQTREAASPRLLLLTLEVLTPGGVVV